MLCPTERVSPDQARRHRARRARAGRSSRRSSSSRRAGSSTSSSPAPPRATSSATRSRSSRSSSAPTSPRWAWGRTSRATSCSGLVARFIEIELAIALLGGVSATAMFLAFAHLGEAFRFVLFGFVVLIGVLVGPRDPARDAHPPRPPRLPRARGDGAVVRLSRRARGVARVPAGARAAARAHPDRVPVRPDERARRRVGAVALPRAARSRSAGARRRSRSSSRSSARGFAGADRLTDVRRGGALRRPHRARAVEPLPAHRGDEVAQRRAPVPERQPAVQLRRRVPLPRGARASGARHAARRAARARARRRRRSRGARDPALPADRVGDAGRPRSGDDPALRRRAAPARAEQATRSPRRR